jgi:hypothetical protein
LYIIGTNEIARAYRIRERYYMWGVNEKGESSWLDSCHKSSNATIINKHIGGRKVMMRIRRAKWPKTRKT